MRISFILAALIAFAACSRGAMAVDVVVGSFEGTTLGGGWSDWGYNGPHEFANSTKGVTQGTSSLKLTPGTLGFAQSLAFKLQSLPNNVAAYDGFIHNTHIAYDVTWDSSEWNYTGSGWNGARLMLVYNEQGAGWDPPIGINPDANGFRQPDLDTGNPSNQGFWDLTNYPGVHTRTMLWDYSHLLPALTSTATGGYTEFILESNFGSFNWPASVYIDNIRFTTPTVVLPLLGDFNLSGVVDAADYTLWRDNFNAANDSVLNGRGDNVAGVGLGDYTVWKSNFGKHGSGAGAGEFVASAVPEPAAWLLGLCTFGWISQMRRRN